MIWACEWQVQLDGSGPRWICSFSNIIRTRVSPLSALPSSLSFWGSGGKDGCSCLAVHFLEKRMYIYHSSQLYIYICLSLPHLIMCSSLKQMLWLRESEMLFGFSLGEIPIHCYVLLAPLTPPKSLGLGVRNGSSTDKTWSKVMRWKKSEC